MKQILFSFLSVYCSYKTIYIYQYIPVEIQDVVEKISKLVPLEVGEQFCCNESQPNRFLLIFTSEQRRYFKSSLTKKSQECKSICWPFVIFGPFPVSQKEGYSSICYTERRKSMRKVREVFNFSRQAEGRRRKEQNTSKAFFPFFFPSYRKELDRGIISFSGDFRLCFRHVIAVSPENKRKCRLFNKTYLTALYVTWHDQLIICIFEDFLLSFSGTSSLLLSPGKLVKRTGYSRLGRELLFQFYSKHPRAKHIYIYIYEQ